MLYHRLPEPASFQRALAYWGQLAPAGSLPAYRQFDPVAVPELLPSLVVREVLHGPLDFRYRLIGEAVRAHLPTRYLGQRMRAIAHQGPETPAFQALCSLVACRRPQTCQPAYLGADPRIEGVDVLLLPFAQAADEVEIVIAVEHFRETATTVLDGPCPRAHAPAAGPSQERARDRRGASPLDDIPVTRTGGSSHNANGSPSRSVPAKTTGVGGDARARP